MIIGLRQKLVLGFGGLLAILLIVGSLSIVVLRLYSGAMNKFLYENYRSVVYGQKMRDALDHLDHAAKVAIDGAAPNAAQVNAAIAEFEENLAAENQNVTLHPREDQLVASLDAEWARYKTAFNDIASAALPMEKRRQSYQSLPPLSAKLREDAQDIITINLENMVVEDGQVKQTAVTARHAMYVLIFVGVALAAVFVTVLRKSILQPLQTLTQSAREIEQGNLDLVVQAPSRDEVGQLAEAFNSMAARLREFRRTDRAKFLRTQRTTQIAVDSLPDAIAIISPSGDVELANDAARKLFRLAPDTAIADAGLNGLADLYQRVVRDGRPYEPHGYEAAIQVFDQKGQERFFLPRGVPIIDADRQLIGVTLVLADVTNLRRLDEMKSGMLSVVSHELKTPLTSMRMAVHLLLEERIGPLTPKQSELLVAAREDSDRLQKIIENLLDMGRIESGRGLMELKSTLPDQLVSQAIEPLRSAFLERGIELAVEIPADTPPVLADMTRIDHVFSNLLTNALKYTPAGGRVRIAAETEDQAVRFYVEDTGRGIPSQFLGRVFERFFRVPGQTGGSGAGLGLAIAKEIVEAHGGQIGVESQVDRGSKFNFTLQRADVPKTPSRPPHRRQKGNPYEAVQQPSRFHPHHR